MTTYSYKGYDFDSDHELSPEEWKQTLAHIDSLPSKSLVDRIPGLAPEVKQPPEDTSPIGVISNVGKALASMPETVASVGSGLLAGAVGGALGGYNSIVTGNNPLQAEKAFSAGMEQFTYQPRTEQGKEDTQSVNKALMEVGLPLAGHTGGFHVPLKPLRDIKPKVEIPPEVSPDIKKTLLASAVKNVENKLNLVKQKEQELMGFENLSPDLQKEQEFLYQQRLKLEADLEHLNSIMGVSKEETLVGKWTLEEKQKKYDDLKSLANSGVKLTEKQIDLFDALGVELERAKAPLEPTARPLEGVKTEEPIPTPELTTLKPLEEPTKPLNEHPPGNVNWDRSQEWKSEQGPNEFTWNAFDKLKEDEYDRLVENNRREAETARELAARTPPEKGLLFPHKEALHDWLDQQINQTKQKIQRVQDLLGWVKENSTKEKPITEIQLKNRKVTTEDLLAARDNLNRDLDKLNQRKTKSLFSEEKLNPDLPPKVYNPDGAKYSKESVLKRLNGVIGKYESMLKRIRDSIHAYEQGVMPSGGTVFTQKGIEYGLDAAKALEEKLTERYTRYINNREKLLNSSGLISEEKNRALLKKKQEKLVSVIKQTQQELDALLKDPNLEAVHTENGTYYPELERKAEELKHYKEQL